MIFHTFKSRFVPVTLALLKIIIGWHFIYEGLIKLLNPSWSVHWESERVEFSIDAKVFPYHNKIHDNMFDLFPVKTTVYMKEVRKPWIAYKVWAAGAIPPKNGFCYAFENGADFICVGMFDFQVVDNVITASKIHGVLKSGKENGSPEMLLIIISELYRYAISICSFERPETITN